LLAALLGQNRSRGHGSHGGLQPVLPAGHDIADSINVPALPDVPWCRRPPTTNSRLICIEIPVTTKPTGRLRVTSATFKMEAPTMDKDNHGLTRRQALGLIGAGIAA
jgi:hypothetical protein